jgi:hypothetical protein
VGRLSQALVDLDGAIRISKLIHLDSSDLTFKQMCSDLKYNLEVELSDDDNKQGLYSSSLDSDSSEEVRDEALPPPLPHDFIRQVEAEEEGRRMPTVLSDDMFNPFLVGMTKTPPSSPSSSSSSLPQMDPLKLMSNMFTASNGKSNNLFEGIDTSKNISSFISGEPSLILCFFLLLLFLFVCSFLVFFLKISVYFDET